MKKVLLLAAALSLLAIPTKADLVLQIGALPNPVPQSLSNPCIICGTNAAAQPVDFGYNNFTSQGNLTSFNMFSTNILGGGNLANGDEIDALPYGGTLLKAIAGLSFGVAIDINTASGGETLQSFSLINLTTSSVLAHITGPIALPDIHNGNGKGDYLLTGFDLSGVSAGDKLLFNAQWSGASDGAESFYLVPTLAVPGPIVGAGIPGIVAAVGAMWALHRRRKLRLA